MSGPKVVTLVTKEEMEAICRTLLAGVDAASAELLAGGGGGGGDLEVFGQELERRRQDLNRLMEQGLLNDMYKLASATTVFIKAEAQRFEAQAVAKALSLHERRRHLASAARGLAKSLPQGEQLEELARRASEVPPEELAGLEQLLRAHCTALMPELGAAGTGAEQQELASRLGQGLVGVRLEDWLAQSVKPASAREMQIARALAELEVCGGEARGQAFARRAAALQGANEARQALLSDSLLLDLGAELQRVRQLAVQRGKLKEAQAKLKAVGGAKAAAMEQRLEAAIAASASSAAETEALLAEAEKTLKEVLAEIAAAARHRALLKGLATLGYEVREDMATALVHEGRIVVHKSGKTDYGVEIGAPASSERLQVRVVASDRPSPKRSADRDRDQEVLWCGEVEKLGELLEAEGSHLEIEKGLAPGVAPIKVVALGASSADAESREAAKPKQRRLSVN